MQLTPIQGIFNEKKNAKGPLSPITRHIIDSSLDAYGKANGKWQLLVWRDLLTHLILVQMS